MKLLSTSAALVGLASTAFAAPDAGIYTYAASSAPAPSAIPTISPSNARLILADLLDLSQYHSLDSADDETLALLAGSTSQRPLFEEAAEEKSKILLFFDGVQDVEDVLPEEKGRRRRIASLSEVPSKEKNRNLVTEMVQTGSTEPCKFDRPEAVTGGRHSNEASGACLTFSSVFDVLTSTAELIKELPRNLAREGASFGAYHIDLPKDAKEYKEAVSAAANLMKQLSSGSKLASQDIVVVVSPAKATSQQASWGSASSISKRSEEAPLKSLKESTAPSRPVLPAATGNSSNIRTTMERCGKSKSDCESRTNKCSGHGSCSKKYANDKGECWVCQCTATTINAIPQYWGGVACQKRDISVQFWLFAGFGILGTAAVAWGIGLLYSMGESELPSVLSAGVAPSSRK